MTIDACQGISSSPGFSYRCWPVSCQNAAYNTGLAGQFRAELVKFGAGYRLRGRRGSHAGHRLRLRPSGYGTPLPIDRIAYLVITPTGWTRTGIHRYGCVLFGEATAQRLDSHEWRGRFEKTSAFLLRNVGSPARSRSLFKCAYLNQSLI